MRVNGSSYNRVTTAKPLAGKGGDEMAAAKSHKIGRDAKTGEFIPVKDAKRRPSTTTVETIKPGKKK